jgi:hypothetical protein
MFSEARKARDAERIAYLENELEDWIGRDPEGFLQTVRDRALLATKDIFGADSPAMRFMDSILATGKPHPATFNELLTYKGTSLIDPQKAQVMGQDIAYELLRVHDGESEHYIENNLYGFWSDLEDAGMSHHDIGRYFERFENVQASKGA